MMALNQTKRMALGYLVAALSFSSFAVTVTPNSLSITAGNSQNLQAANISGTVTLKSSKSGIVTVSQVDASTYKISGVKAGSVVLEFKDKKTTAKVNVTVTANTAVPLNGRLLASNCFQCHGTDGKGGFEKLTGKSANEIYGDLKAFASGKEDSEGIMAAHAMGFSDEQLKSVASYFSSIR